MKKTISVILTAAMLLASLLCVRAAAAEETVSVPKITVVTESGKGTELQKDDGYVKAEIGIDDGKTVFSDNVSFKVRGNTTAMKSVKKKAYTFKFSAKTDVLGMGSGKKWALIANAFDPTLLRNYSIFQLAEKLGLAYTSKQQFVELWLDGSYRGLYTLMEPVQDGKDRVDINTKKGDFLIEYEAKREEDGVTYFTAGGHRFIASAPDEPDETQLEHMRSVTDDIINTMKSGDKAAVSEKIDLDSFVKFYLLNEYAKTYDFGISSVYFYYKNGKLFAGPPWDYDISTGNTTGKDYARSIDVANPEGIYANKNIYTILCKYDWFYELCRDEYIAHRADFTEIGSDGGILDTLRETYYPLIEKNYSEAWDIGKWWINVQRKPDGTYAENFDYLKNWCQKRGEWLDKYYEADAEEWLAGDTDGDGKITIDDVTLIQKLAAQLETDEKAAVRGNVTGEPLSVNDATELQKYLAGFENSFGVGEKRRVHTPVQ